MLNIRMQIISYYYIKTDSEHRFPKNVGLTQSNSIHSPKVEGAIAGFAIYRCYPLFPHFIAHQQVH